MTSASTKPVEPKRSPSGSSMRAGSSPISVEVLPKKLDEEVAELMVEGFGGVVTFELDGDFDATSAFVDRCRIPYIGPSLGGAESLIEMPALMSYWDLTREVKLLFDKEGITIPFPQRDVHQYPAETS